MSFSLTVAFSRVPFIRCWCSLLHSFHNANAIVLALQFCNFQRCWPLPETDFTLIYMQWFSGFYHYAICNAFIVHWPHPNKWQQQELMFSHTEFEYMRRVWTVQHNANYKMLKFGGQNRNMKSVGPMEKKLKTNLQILDGKELIFSTLPQYTFIMQSHSTRFQRSPSFSLLLRLLTI